MKKFFGFFFTALVFVSLSTPVFAAGEEFSVIPKADVDLCQGAIENNWYNDPESLKDEPADVVRGVLGCAITTGNIHFWMFGYFLGYAIRVLLMLSGLISTIFIVIGGYRYIIGGLTDDKESGKKTIMHAIAGLVLSLLAYLIVSVVQIFVTT